MRGSFDIGLLKGRLIVSCQASPEDAFGEPGLMARFARAARDGGAGGIRANGPADVSAIRAAVSVPLIGIQKAIHADGRILITPTLDCARRLCEAGADIVALDCTGRGVAAGALDRLRRIRTELGAPVMADIATLEEARAAAANGASFIGTTMRGYTDETRHIAAFDREFVAALTAAMPVPVIAEGMIWSPEEARAALAAGAYAVVVGTAITRPHEITRRFAQALRQAGEHDVFAGVDCGGTRIKHGLVDRAGRLLEQGSLPTPVSGRAGLLQALRETFQNLRRQAESRGLRVAAAGLATAGWVNRAGEVVHATGNLPGWAGTRLREELEEAAGGRLAVENDAHAFALAERRFGSARGVAEFLFVTLGTGVGGACVSEGRLLRGAHEMGGALGHLSVDPGGHPCTCGGRGCLEAYAASDGLRQSAGAERFEDAAAVVTAAQAGDPAAVAAVERQAGYLAEGLAQAILLTDPELIVLGGGLAEGNELLRARLEQELPRRVFGGVRRKLRVTLSPLGYHAGVLGAAAAAMESVSFVRS